MLIRRFLAPAFLILLAMLAMATLSSDSRIEAQTAPAGGSTAEPATSNVQLGRLVELKDLERVLGKDARTKILFVRDPRLEWTNDPMPENGLDFLAPANNDPYLKLLQFQMLDRQRVLDDLWSVVSQIDNELDRADVDRKSIEKKRDLYDVYMAILKDRLGVLVQTAAK